MDILALQVRQCPKLKQISRILFHSGAGFEAIFLRWLPSKRPNLISWQTFRIGFQANVSSWPPSKRPELASKQTTFSTKLWMPVFFFNELPSKQTSRAGFQANAPSWLPSQRPLSRSSSDNGPNSNKLCRSAQKISKVPQEITIQLPRGGRCPPSAGFCAILSQARSDRRYIALSGDFLGVSREIST